MELSDFLQMTTHQIFGSPPKRGDFGVELELEFPQNGIIPQAPEGWEMKPENSLRGNACEYVVRQPHSRDGVYNRVKALADSFKGAGIFPVDSYRASTHIHYNVQKKPIINVLGSLIVYTILEPLVLRALGPMRDGNLFCLSSYDTGDLVLHMNSLAHFCLQQRGWPERGKYASWSLDPLRRFGSVECRVFPNCYDPDTIIKWCTWMKNIVETASNCPDKTFIEILDEAQNNASFFAQKMLDIPGLPKLARPNSVESLIHYGCEQAYECCRVLQNMFEQKKVTLTNKRGVRPRARIPEPVEEEMPDMRFIDDEEPARED